jgi:hypothetical protein
MLFAGDVCTNLMGLGDPVGFESLKEGRASQRKLASLSFDAAGFGHGGPIARDASTRFRNKWGKKSPMGTRSDSLQGRTNGSNQEERTGDCGNQCGTLHAVRTDEFIRRSDHRRRNPALRVSGRSTA